MPPHPLTPLQTLNALPLPTYASTLLPPLTPLTHTQRHDGSTATFTPTLESAATLSPSDLKACFDLIAMTSKEDYKGSSIGWKPAAKRREMRLPDLRYLLLKTQDRGDGDGEEGKEGVVQGFTSFMLTYEDGREVIYLYEIHLSSQLRGGGLGKQLVCMVEEVGRRAGVEKVMLTVFAVNEGASGFYKGLGYGVDEFGPRPRKFRTGEVKNCDYVILSKALAGGGGKGKKRKAV